MHFEPWTLALQTANFLILIWLLQRFLYRPVLAVIAARQAQAGRLIAEMEAQKSAAETLRRTLEARQSTLQASEAVALASAREAAESERKALLDKARLEADGLRAEAAAAAAEDRDEIARTLGRDAARLSLAIVRRLLDEDTTAAVQARQLDLVCEDLAALPADTRGHIAERLAAHGGATVVVTATPLPPETASAIGPRLTRALGAPVKPELEVDGALLAGVELRFPFTILRRTWAESLALIETELLNDDRASPVT